MSGEVWDWLGQNQLHLTQFSDAYEAHQAAGACLHTMNHPPKDTPDAIAAQRKALLKIPFQILIKRRDALLDEFCAAWINARKSYQAQP